VEDLIWDERPSLRNPMLVVAFKGWNDAGEAATAAMDYLIESFGGYEVARIDPEEYYDFTAVRPTVRLLEGRTREIDWPQNVLHAAHVPGAESDLLLFQGVEPSLRWKRFTGSILGGARQMGAHMVITLGALLADVPHTRPVPITGIASDETLVARMGFERSNYEGPTGVVGVLHHACAGNDIPSVSLWAAVPHYVAASPNPKAALALLRSFEGVAGVAVDALSLEDQAGDYERQVNAAVASDPDVKAFVERLEETVDEVQDDAPPERIPSADSIARDFQRFLKQRRANGPS
jgi:predicted ATP-grasp superfamily ATP-dependent carboligase